MGEISEKDRGVFADANGSVGLDFTSDEQLRIAQLAEELKAIMDNAKKRLREKFGGSVAANIGRRGVRAD